ncbi:serine--tRNA ligase [Frankia sp. Cppng1_Ct_nod]|uniref:serine--tRNA ligase n=1 Tax=Frankia sp. Cppng1_Ct_nod TaxID=2897162 RepID=UPI0010411D80|nr:serine--tRNA ligase [Frankia sp. Cppng1_Ct_nod]
MLDRRFIRENPDAVREAARVKGVDLDVDDILTLDREVRSLQHALDTAQRERRELAGSFKAADAAERTRLRERSGALDEQLRETREQLEDASGRLRELLLRTPNIPWAGAPVGADESANTVIRVWGERPTFDFTPVDHVELAEKRGWVEFERARNASGERAYALAGQLVLLERAVHSYALDLLAHRDFRLVSVPSLVKEDALVGSGFLPGHREEIYELPADGMFLAGTAEVALVGLHAGEMLSVRDLPLRYAGISPCFRREVGSAGRDVRGLLRVHQFEKVEQFVICAADGAESARWHAELLDTAETVLQSLGLAYEVVECATGDMGLGKFRMNDINTWFPSLERFRETHSCSTLHDWQARRANIRYKDADGRVRFAHTLNNTAVATPRLLAAILENFQTADHHIRVPKVLRPYLGDRELI